MVTPHDHPAAGWTGHSDNNWETATLQGGGKAVVCIFEGEGLRVAGKGKVWQWRCGSGGTGQEGIGHPSSDSVSRLAFQGVVRGSTKKCGDSYQRR